MKKIILYANQYIRESDWKILAMLKFCLFSLGILVGMCIPKGRKKVPMITAGIVFTATYIPLMTKFINIIKRKYF